MFSLDVLLGMAIPFLGTVLGSACVFFMRKSLGERVSKALSGFAAGVMVAASVWSLIIPALNMASGLGTWSFVPVALGYLAGTFFLLLLDHIIPHLHVDSSKAEGPSSKLRKTTLLVLSVTLHNIPEGMAVGVVYAGLLKGNGAITTMGALAMAIGIAIQNFPEGAIISMPLRGEGKGKARAFLSGCLSGLVEPIGMLLTIAFASIITPAMPFLLSFASGAMLYVVVEELVPGMAEGQHSNAGAISFALGFALMMVLDVVLG